MNEAELGLLIGFLIGATVLGTAYLIWKWVK